MIGEENRGRLGLQRYRYIPLRPFALSWCLGINEQYLCPEYPKYERREWESAYDVEGAPLFQMGTPILHSLMAQWTDRGRAS